MKLKNLTNQTALTVVGLFALAYTSSTRLSLAQDFIVSAFDFDTEGWSFAFGVSGTATWDPMVDADGNPASGSLYYTASYANSPNGWQDSNLQRLVSVVTGDYETIAYDVKVDVANSSLSAGGNYEGCTLVLRGNDVNWTEVGHTQLNNGDWNHVEAAIPVAATMLTWGMNLRFFPNPNESPTNYNFIGPISYWIDNIKFIAPTAPPPPPTMKIEPAGPGLELIASASGQYQRQAIRTLDPFYTWVNSTGAVSYALTILKPPPPGSEGFGTHMFLVGTDNLDPGSDADYNEPNAIFLEIQQQADGAYQASLRYKTNAPGSHGIRYTPEGLLAILNNLPGTGTWTVTLNQTAVTLTAPDNTSTNGMLPADALPLFANLFVHLGVQPNDFGHINKSATLSRFQITGAPDFVYPLDQMFTAQDVLDTAVWTIRAEDAGGIQPHPTTTAYRLSWNLPASGFELRSAPSLPPSWTDPGLPAVNAGARRLTFVTAAALPSPNGGFFVLYKAP